MAAYQQTLCSTISCTKTRAVRVNSLLRIIQQPEKPIKTKPAPELHNIHLRTLLCPVITLKCIPLGKHCPILCNLHRSTFNMGVINYRTFNMGIILEIYTV